jgi:predicted nucleic acid-binding protein
MRFADLAAGDQVFLDANTLVYYFGPHPVFGPACNQLIERIENQELQGFTSTHALSAVAHHLMTLEASALFGWATKVVQRLKNQPTEIQKLGKFRSAVETVPQLGIQVLAIPPHLVASAAALSQQTGLLSNDALIVALMQHHGLTKLASGHADFDRVPTIARFAPF